MAQPQAYNRTKDFTVDFQNETDHSALNAEFDAAANSINETRANLSLIQADDGALRPQAVTYESLAPDLISQLVANIDEYAVHINETAIRAAEAAQVSAEAASQKADDASASADAAEEAASSFDINTHKDAILQWVYDAIYPVGSTYITFNNQDDPNRFGGTWTEIAQGFALISAGANYTSGHTYGANTKKITVDNLPEHRHSGTTKASGKHKHDKGNFEIGGYFGGVVRGNSNTVSTYVSGAFSDGGSIGSKTSGALVSQETFWRKINFKASNNWTGYTSEQADHTHQFDTGNTGSGEAFNVMQQSTAVHIWRRRS